MHPMKQFKMIIAMVVLISSIVIFAISFLNQQPIDILLETGQEVTTASEYFTLTKVLIFSITSFLIGAAIIYIFYNSDKENNVFNIIRPKGKDEYALIMPLLKDDEKKAMLALKENKGEILQNKLVLKLGVSKVKATRILSRLERKGLIIKDRYGLTNRIKFAK